MAICWAGNNIWRKTDVRGAVSPKGVVIMRTTKCDCLLEYSKSETKFAHKLPTVWSTVRKVKLRVVYNTASWTVKYERQLQLSVTHKKITSCFFKDIKLVLQGLHKKFIHTGICQRFPWKSLLRAAPSESNWFIKNISSVFCFLSLYLQFLGFISFISREC
jgi:hypothetical protein